MKINQHVVRFANPYNGMEGICGVSVIRHGPDVAVTVITELPVNPGMSVTNAFEHISGRVRRTFQGDMDPDQIIWVERYLDGTMVGTAGIDRGETFDLVHLDWVEGGYRSPRWSALGNRSQDDFWRILFGFDRPANVRLPRFVEIEEAAGKMRI